MASLVLSTDASFHMSGVLFCLKGSLLQLCVQGVDPIFLSVSCQLVGHFPISHLRPRLLLYVFATPTNHIPHTASALRNDAHCEAVCLHSTQSSHFHCTHRVPEAPRGCAQDMCPVYFQATSLPVPADSHRSDGPKQQIKRGIQ